MSKLCNYFYTTLLIIKIFMLPLHPNFEIEKSIINCYS